MEFLQNNPLSNHRWGPSNTSFWSALLELHDDIEIQMLQDKHIPKAIKGYDAAFKDDPLMLWFAGEEKAPPYKNVYLAWSYFTAIRTKIAITVDGGSSVVTATPPPSDHKGLKEWFLEWCAGFLAKLGYATASKGKRVRMDEYRGKLEAAVTDKIGERVKQMILVDLVFTAPESQGHGYGSALLAKITKLADMLGEASWLVSSNIYNENFYNHHGFKTVGDVVFAANDPDYEKPVVVQLMVREPCKKETHPLSI